MRHRPDLPLAAFISCFVLTSLLPYTHGIPDFSGLPPGPYCAGRYPAGQCCLDRMDNCSAPLLTTTCYCDEFCDRFEDEDCCPDYWTHCKGLAPPAVIPPENIRRGCSYKGKYVDHGSSVKDNCNKCKCTSMGERAEVLCEMNRCLVEPELLDRLNIENNLGWRAENHSEFWGRTLDEGIHLRLGTLNPSRTVFRMNPVRRFYNPDALPLEFDSRTRWPNQLRGVRDQGWCGASWALSTVDVASDRFAVMSMGAEQVQLAGQHLLSCNNKGQQGCKGGYLDRAWMFTRKFGLVDEDCYRWTGKPDKCKIRKGSTLRNAGCYVPYGSQRTELYKVGPSYRLGNETDIMQEIMTSGPVQATMKVYQDFFVYKSGIYRHSEAAAPYRTGYHSVRIIGWGEERSRYGIPTKYWTVANSWGSGWGENGFFRIQRGTNECEIETFVLAAWAKTSKL